ncbi:CASP-like protein 1F2 [Euphorbia peplus]|nr:CASP-like protein 1F2 [Euphorbia peplus]
MASTDGGKDAMRTSSNNGEMKTSNGVMMKLYYTNSAERRYFMTHFMLRIVAIASAVASIGVMVTSHQTVMVFGIYTTARYQYSSAYRFLVGADAVACGFCLVSLVFLCRLYSSKTRNITSFFYLLLHDMVMMVLLASGCAAATAIGYVGRFGEEKINWGAVCDYVANFCNQILVSTILSYISFFCFFALTILSAHNLIFTSHPNP